MKDKTNGQGTSESTTSKESIDWVGYTFSGSASGQTGKLEMRWLRSGNILTIQTLRYLFTGNGTSNKANINIVVDAHNAGEWKLNSPDNRIQNGEWHEWAAQGTLGLGNSVRMTIKVEFIFDLAGPDDRAIATQHFDV